MVYFGMLMKIGLEIKGAYMKRPMLMFVVVTFLSIGFLDASQDAKVIVPQQAKQLLHALHRLFDNVMQKATSGTESDVAVNQWDYLTQYYRLRNDLMSLNRKRYITLLNESKDSSIEQLMEGLKSLYKDLKQQEQRLVSHEVTTTKTREEAQLHLNDTKALLSILEMHIKTLIPQVTAFLDKQKGITKGLSDQADSKRQKALSHAKNAAKKVDKEAEESSVVSEQAQVAGETQQVVSAQDEQLAEQGAEEKKAKVTPYAEALTALDSHLDSFKPKQEQEFINFVIRVGDSYPNANSPQPPARRPVGPLAEEDWLYGRKQYKGQGFADYQHFVVKEHTPFSVELEDLKNLSDTLIKHIPHMSKDELQALQTNQNLQTLVVRVQKYKQAYEQADQAIQKTFNINVSVPFGTILDPLHLSVYKAQHDNVVRELQRHFYDPIMLSEHGLEKVKRKIKQYLNVKS